MVVSVVACAHYFAAAYLHGHGLATEGLSVEVDWEKERIPAPRIGRLIGDGGAGTWIVSGSFGVAWVLDRPDCVYPDTGWCTESAWAAGPTLGLGFERRFQRARVTPTSRQHRRR
jgi:hypothetical protein